MAADDETDSNSESGAAADNGHDAGHQPRHASGGAADGDRSDAENADNVEDTDENEFAAEGLGDDDPDEVDDAESDSQTDEPELVGVGATRRGAGEDSGSAADASPQSETGKSESNKGASKLSRQKKDRPTPRQSTAGQPKRTTPAAFVRGSVGELRKVVYPTRSQLSNYFVVVLIFVMLVIAIVTALDYGFGAVILKVFA